MSQNAYDKILDCCEVVLEEVKKADSHGELFIITTSLISTIIGICTGAKAIEINIANSLEKLLAKTKKEKK